MQDFCEVCDIFIRALVAFLCSSGAGLQSICNDIFLYNPLRSNHFSGCISELFKKDRNSQFSFSLCLIIPDLIKFYFHNISTSFAAEIITFMSGKKFENADHSFMIVLHAPGNRQKRRAEGTSLFGENLLFLRQKEGTNFPRQVRPSPSFPAFARWYFKTSPQLILQTRH